MNAPPTQSLISKREAGAIFLVMAAIPIVMGAYGMVRMIGVPKNQVFLPAVYPAMIFAGIPFLIAAIACFRAGRKKPNQALEPTAMSVTSRAAHEPRQP